VEWEKTHAMEWKWNESCWKFVEWNGMIENCCGMEWKWNSNFQDFGPLVCTVSQRKKSPEFS
jgi:hypothetical protein